MPLVQTKQESRERPCQLNRASVVLGSVLDAAPAPDDEADELDAACSLLFIQIDNSEHPQHTMMQIQTKDYPGLHRAVAWTLNGLSIRAQNAEIKRDPDGFADMRFWLSDLNGQRLSDRSAFDLKESLTDFIEVCTPPREDKKIAQWSCKVTGAFVSNDSNDQYTELVIAGEPEDGHKAGFLLELFTVLNASGATIQSSTIQSSADFSPLHPTRLKGHDFKRGRVFRFLLSDGEDKLRPGRIQSLLFMIQLIKGKGYQPTSVDGGQCYLTAGQSTLPSSAL